MPSQEHVQTKGLALDESGHGMTLDEPSARLLRPALDHHLDGLILIACPRNERERKGHVGGLGELEVALIAFAARIVEDANGHQGELGRDLIVRVNHHQQGRALPIITAACGMGQHRQQT
jgi:hypothetical protein